MNNKEIDRLFENLDVSDSIQRINLYPSVKWVFQAAGYPILVQTQETVNRMRIVAFIKDSSDIAESCYAEMLEANYHSALDVRYAMNDGYVVSAFLHPLNELNPEQFVRALFETISCAETFGSNYSGASLYFGRLGQNHSSADTADPLTSFREKVNDQTTDNKVFISYSHNNGSWLDKLLMMIKPIVRSNEISIWYDENIKPSQTWRKEINDALRQAKVALLLVSPEFLASDFIAKEELPYLLNKAKQGAIRVTWILLSPCLHRSTEIGSYQALHDINKPLNALNEFELNTL